MHKQHQNFVVYTPESQLRHPRKLFKTMGQDLLASRELAWRLMVRDISAQYRQSFLGIFWALIPPIVTAVGLTLASRAQVINIGETDLPYPAYVMFSMTLWQTFTEAVLSPIQAIANAKGMLAKIKFPREAIILAQLGQLFFNFAIKLLLILGLFIWFKMPVGWSSPLALVSLIHLVMLGTAIGLLLFPIGGLYQDISKALLPVMGVWFFLTPVIYPVPEGGIFSLIVRWNPVTPLLVTTRELATGFPLSNPTGFWITSLVAIISLLLAWLVCRLAMPFIVERMSA